MANKSGQPEQQDEPWEACPAGVLHRMVERVDSAQRRRRTRQTIGTAALSTALFATVAFAVGSLMGPRGTYHGGIPCSVCRSHFAEYDAHLTGEQLIDDESLVASMQSHLESCTFCRERFKTLYPNVLSATQPPVVMFPLRPVLAFVVHRTLL